MDAVLSGERNARFCRDPSVPKRASFRRVNRPSRVYRLLAEAATLGRLRVLDLNPAHQSALFTVYRYHAVFTDSPLPMLEAEATHRAHAIIEQVIADLKNGPLAHLPSGRFWANSAWLVCAALAFNLTRAAGSLASAFHARATTATVRAHLITIPARLARSARRLILHLPQRWPWATAWQRLLHGCRHRPPRTA